MCERVSSSLALASSTTSAGSENARAGAYTLIVTADHGGHQKDHGSADARDVHIPWIAWGRGVQPGVLEPDSVQTIATASTVLYLLGVERPAAWRAGPVSGAFTSAHATQ